MELVRNIFIFLTFLISGVGFCCFVIGCWAASDAEFKNDVKKVGIELKGTDHHLKMGGVVVLLVGLATIVISLLGCFGAWKRRSRFLLAFGIILIPLLIIFLACLILFVCSPKYAADMVDEVLKEDNLEEIKMPSAEWNSYDAFQKDNDCCFWKNEDDRCTGTSESKDAWVDCKLEVTKKVKKILHKYLPVIITFNVFELLLLIGGIVAAFYLSRRVNELA